jgi:hypothetical protein
MGIAVGYALGAKGGRQWYEEFKNAAARDAAPEPAPPVSDVTAVDARSRMQQLIGNGLRASSRMLRDS